MRRTEHWQDSGKIAGIGWIVMRITALYNDNTLLRFALSNSALPWTKSRLQVKVLGWGRDETTTVEE